MEADPTGQMEAPGRTGVAPFFSAYGVPALVVLAFLGALIAVQAQTEAAAAGVAALLPVGYAFGAGMVASVNPCGFMLLPSYLSYQLGTEEAGFFGAPPVVRAGRAALLGTIATAGFIVVFASVGAVIALGGRWVATVFPYAGITIGVAMVALGLWLLVSHGTLGLIAAGRMAVPPGRNLRNVFLFGIAYALGSLSCTLPIFLAVVGAGLATQDVAQSFGQFLSYALGMGTVLVAVTLGAALAREAAARRLRALVPHVHRISALFLVGAGGYLLYYWLFFARLFG